MTGSGKLQSLEGVDQSRRLLPALAEGYFNVDEMTFEDLITASVEFAAQLKYYNTSNQASGDWRSFLAANEIVIMALIINKDSDALRREFNDKQASSPRQRAEFILGLIAEIDGWLSDLRRSDSAPARDLSAKLEIIIRNTLREEVQALLELTVQQQGLDAELPFIELARLSNIWRKPADEDLGKQQRANLDRIGSADDVQHYLSRVGYEFVNAIEHLKSICRSLLPASLKTQSHDPAVSLFITFLKLYRYAQDNINAFTSRHLDFYYRDILRTRQRDKSPESVVLNFALAEGSGPVEIARGRRFTCARDEQLRDVVFEATDDLVVNDIELGAMYTLRLDREPMITPECDMNFVTRIHKQHIPLNLETDSDSAEQSWPLFGNSEGQQSQGVQGLESLQLGVAVASRVLFLEEGDRRIELEFELSRIMKPVSSYIELLEKAQTREEFISGLYELMLGWMGNPEHKNWDLAVSGEVMAGVLAIADSIDARMDSLAAAEQQLQTCRELFEETVERIRHSRDKSLPYYSRLNWAESGAEFRAGLGALVTHHLLENGSVTDLLQGKLDNKARELGCENSLDSIKRELAIGKERLVKKYLGTAFLFNLSTEDGWLGLDRYDVQEADEGDVGFRIVLSLSSEAPGIVGCLPAVHGEQWQTELPLMKLSINPEASLNVYSMLEQYCLDRISIHVDVHGVRNVVAFNSISQLDPSKPFFPFGPAPTTSSYLALSAPEAARKPLTRFGIHLHWGDLPQGDEGFDGHYAGYRSRFRNGSFTAKVNVLTNGGWQPKSEAQIQSAALFSAQGKKLNEHQYINVESADYLRPVAIDEEAFDLGLRTRNGFIKLTLATPDAAFGHQQYPVKLSETLESNAKTKRVKKKRNLPNPPYTPLLNKIAIDYSATSTLNMNSQSDNQGERHPERIYRLHAFGTQAIYPNTGGGEIQFFKPFDHDGNLLLGLSGSNVRGLLSLYFSLADDSVRSKSGISARHYWSYLGANGWTPLRADQIVSDGTKGFLCSGIITLDLPGDISKRQGDMAGDYYWLRVSTDRQSRDFCSLRSIRTHAMEFRRDQTDGASFDAQSGNWSKLQWQPVQSIPGLGTISQLDAFLDVDKQETRQQLITRISERIRHRSRAVSAWDYERLVLEKFPVVGKVMCLPNRSTAASGIVPGSLLVVVTPRVSDPQSVIGKTPRLSAVYLNDIQEYLASLGSAFANIEVTNPSYEWVQVRCAAVFEKYASGGKFIDWLNEDIGKYLNPWDETGYGLKFCQPVKREDLYSYLYNLDYIKYVTDFSMLHITRDTHGAYKLGDTVHREIVEGKDPNITPLYPWSLAVPMRRHYIEVSKEIEPKAPDITGIRELQIGSTFIIGGM